MSDTSTVNGTILVVDDDAISCSLLTELLQSAGYHCATANSGRAALQAASTLTPDLILLDVMMREMNGFEVCQHLRATPHLATIPIMLITALDDRESRMRGFEVGADDFLSKPVNLAELRTRVHTITRLNRYQRLLTERARFDRLIELSPDGILIIDLAGTIHLANPAMLHMLGADEAAVIGQSVQTFLAPAYHTNGNEFLDQIRANPDQAPNLIRVDTTFQRLDRSLLPVEINTGQFVWEDQTMLQLIVRDISERQQATREHQRLLRELAERERRLQDLVEKLLASQEEERRRVAYELHDGLAQVASSAYQHLQAFAGHYRPRTPRRRAEIERALALAQQVVQEARQVIAGLRPTVLDDFGLASALRVVVEQMRADGWEVTYAETAPAGRLPPAVETALFRVAQEALTNVRKHAQTIHVAVALHCYAQAIRLEVRDWGCGFVPMDGADGAGASARGEQIGLLSMQERMALLGGTVQIESQPGVGTRIVAVAPLSTAVRPPATESASMVSAEEGADA